MNKKQIEAIFFDDGGVMNNNELRGPEWKRLISEYFIPKFGGTHDKWAKANNIAIKTEMKNIEFLYEKKASTIPQDYYEKLDQDWIKIMFDEMNIKLPENSRLLSIESRKWITKRVKSSYDGIIELIKELSNDYRLFTASNEVSYELEGYLTGMGIIDHFEILFGADLLFSLKSSPVYYEKIAEITNINPINAIVIDDKSIHLDYARSVGYNTIHSGNEGEKKGNHPYYKNVNELRSLIKNYS